MRNYGRERKCSCCGKNLCFLSAPMNQWAYKIQLGGTHFLWQCSYSCHRKETERRELENDKQRYNNARRG